jgi:Tfp pilus assembly protein PilN
MINLLPDEVKKEIRAARSNVALFNYIIIIFLAVLFLAGIFATVYVVLTNTKTNAENVIKENHSRTTSYTSVQQQADSLKASLSTAKTILDRQTLYSKVLTGIAGAMPSGVVISNLNLSPTALGTPITLQAYAKSTADALKLKDNFQRSSLFSGVSFQSLTPGSASAASGYPIGITLSLTINKGAAQ